MSSQPLPMPVRELPELDREVASRLTEFARACKAAARAVSLYPTSHPAIRGSLSRLSDTGARLTADGPVALGVLPDNLLVNGAASPRPDQATRETGALLHDHLIGILTIHSSPDADGWLPFLRLLGRSVDEVRAAGGFGRLWSATGQRHLGIQEIDYADILRDRKGLDQRRWDDIIRACLNLDSPLDDEMLQQLLDVCGDAERFGEFVLALEQRATGGTGSKASALLRMLRGVLDLVARTDAARLEPMLRTMAEGMGKLSPELFMELLAADRNRADAAADLVLHVAARMTDSTLAGFVARGVIAEGGATVRLAEAFQTLVPDDARRPALLDMAKTEVEQSPLGESEGFVDLWTKAAEILTSYTDTQFVSDSYARELSGARTQALEVERVSDDPLERIGGWVSSINAAQIRALDLQLLLDLLRLESDPERWRKITPPAIGHIEDLLFVGDFEGALQLVETFAKEANGTTRLREPASAALTTLVGGSMMGHLTSHLRTVEDPTVEQIKTFCHAVGTSIIKPLAEALSIEKRTTVRQRLTQLLIGFGAAGRQSVEQLKGSANPAVRRTAIYLLVEFGGSEALPDLTALLDDAEPHIQREAVRAILMIGSEEAYAEVQRALAAGNDKTRESLVSALIAMRSERAAPLFEYIIRKVDRRGPLRSVYLRAIESLGVLKADHTVGLLQEALYSGEWWAPRRTAELRRTVAEALREIGSAEALEVLSEAAKRGSRGVRNAVRAVRA